ncbi:MAG TPA: hypothetical protein VEY92_06310, partial [Pseudoxanthomonas sp.]|nr:hypothetical protein [Pseudoxanthomonas sp.]
PKGFEELADHYRHQAVQEWLDETVGPLLTTLSPDLQSVFGQDFGRSGDLSVLVPAQIQQNLSRRVPFVAELRNMPHKQQWQIVEFILGRLPRFVKGAFDARGNGHALAEFAAQKFGYGRIDLVMFTEGWYREHMPPLKAAFEDGTISLPRDKDVLADLRAIKVIKGVARVPDARVAGKDGGQRHGDAGIAVALMHFASLHPGAEIEWMAAPRHSRGFDNVGDDDNDIRIPEPQAW